MINELYEDEIEKYAALNQEAMNLIIKLDAILLQLHAETSNVLDEIETCMDTLMTFVDPMDGV